MKFTTVLATFGLAAVQAQAKGPANCVRSWAMDNKECLVNWRDQFPEAAEALMGCVGNLRDDNRQLRSSARELGDKGAGDQCSSNSDCVSNTCQGGICMGNTGDSCVSSDHCKSRMCTSGTCQAPLLGGETCSVNQNCASNACFSFGGGSGQCLCNSHSECPGNKYCDSSNICQDDKQVGADCSAHEECTGDSGCWGEKCGGRGLYAPCTTSDQCDKFMTCASNGECKKIAHRVCSGPSFGHECATGECGKKDWLGQYQCVPHSTGDCRRWKQITNHMFLGAGKCCEINNNGGQSCIVNTMTDAYINQYYGSLVPVFSNEYVGQTVHIDAKPNGDYTIV